MDESVVEIAAGRVRGVRRDGVWTFSGIPYAAPPVGERRWQPPAPPAPWAGVRDATRFGAVAPQTPGMMEQALADKPETQDEACLHLNVWTNGVDDGRRPVMVWVHGGSFVSGSGSGGLYRAGVLAREQDVVVVTLNYRLGLLGFLAHPGLAEGVEDGPWAGGATWKGSGNWGLADQVAALAWVRDHIAAFGGDPANVTLFGESAGSMGVAALLAVPEARGLFRRAVLQSGPPYVSDADRSAERAERLAGELGIPCTRGGWSSVPADRLVAALTEFASRSGGSESGLPVQPVVDGGLLATHPHDAVAAGAAADVDLVVGTTRDEAAFFAVGDPALAGMDDAGLRRWLTRAAPDGTDVDALIGAVTRARRARGEPVTPRDLWVAISTEFVFRVRSLRLADAHAAAARPGVGTFAYLFTWPSPFLDGLLGSCHALEIPFVFGTVEVPAVQTFSGGSPEARHLSALMRSAWASFARDGVPVVSAGGPPAPSWPLWDPGRRPTMVFGPWPDRSGPVGVVDAPRDEEIAAVASIVRL